MDGGRIARALIWWRSGDRNKATRIAAMMGRGFGYLFIAGGLLLIATGDFLSGVWLGFIGIVVNGAARGAAMQTALSSRIGEVVVADVMDREPVAIPGDLSVEQALDEYFLRYRWPWFPVVDTAYKFLGLLQRDRADEVPEVSRASSAVCRHRRPRPRPLRPRRHPARRPPLEPEPAPLRRPDGGRRRRPLERRDHRRAGRPRPPRRHCHPMSPIMAIYLVGFDGKWQEEFDTEAEAVAWAHEVAETGRVVEVVRRRFRTYKFITGFPVTERETARGPMGGSLRPRGLFRRLTAVRERRIKRTAFEAYTTPNAVLFRSGDRAVAIDDAIEVEAGGESAEGLAPVAGEAGGDEGVGDGLVAVADQ